MCYSAQASFTASIILAAIGTATIITARRHKKLLPFAAIPFLFAIQQACEGIIWLTDSANPTGFMHTCATYTFLFFAYLVWPIWIPISACIPEGDRWRQRLCESSLVVGVFFVIFAIARMTEVGVWSRIIDHHIVYPSYGPETTFSLGTLIYLYATGFPLIASSMTYTGVVGAIGLFSLIFTIFWQSAHITSIWCFFAALISASALLVIWTEVKKGSR